MTNEELKQHITSFASYSQFEEGGEFLSVTIPSVELLAFMEELRKRKEFDFDYLFCLTGLDWKEYLTVVYHLFSKTHKHSLVVKGKITDRSNPEIETVSNIWKTAELLECEVYDLFGVKFLHHPNLRRLFMEENWPGYPLRKDYTDINMIEL